MLHVGVVCGVGGGCVGISHVWAGSCSAWAHNENVTTSASINTSQYNNKLDSKKPARDTDYSSSILLFLHDARQISQVYYSSSYKGGWYQSPDIWRQGRMLSRVISWASPWLIKGLWGFNLINLRLGYKTLTSSLNIRQSNPFSVLKDIYPSNFSHDSHNFTQTKLRTWIVHIFSCSRPISLKYS